MESKKITYYYWIDNIKLFACILVVLGHFAMSMTAAGLASCSPAYYFFIQSIYTYHVPLFFVCSGFLYQKSNRVHGFSNWGYSVKSKFLNLSVPYFTFTIITLLIKTIFANEINTAAGDFLTTLFINPTAPYWYLYALFFMFLIIPNFKTKKGSALFLSISIAFVVIYIILIEFKIIAPYIIRSYLGRLVWFAIGIFIAFDDERKISLFEKILCPVSFAAAIILSLIFYTKPNDDNILKYVIGILFVYSIVIFSRLLNFELINKIAKKFSEYFMPVFLMHTIFCAGIRILLLKFNITNIVIHSVLGIIFAFALPIIVYYISERIPFLLFFIYPKKAIAQIKHKKHLNFQR